MPAHPKPEKRPKKPGAMRTKPKPERVEPAKVVKASTLQPKPKPASTGTKSALIMGLLAKGSTSKQLEAATGWASHSVRGFLGTLRRNGVKVISTKLPGQATVYSLEVGDVL